MPLFRIVIIRVGLQVSTKGYPNRVMASAAYAKAVARCARQANLYRIPYRVELWRSETLIEHADIPAGLIVPQPRA
jgi:hypothetical protein